MTGKATLEMLLGLFSQLFLKYFFSVKRSLCNTAEMNFPNIKLDETAGQKNTTQI